LSYTRRRMRR